MTSKELKYKQENVQKSKTELTKRAQQSKAIRSSNMEQQ